MSVLCLTNKGKLKEGDLDITSARDGKRLLAKQSCGVSNNVERETPVSSPLQSPPILLLWFPRAVVTSDHNLGGLAQ